MTRHIDGYYNFKEGDEITINGEVKAKINKVNDRLYLDFTDPMGTELYLGDKNSSQDTIDSIVNAIWNTLAIRW